LHGRAIRESDIELGFKLPNLLTVVRLALALECKVAELTSVFDKTNLSPLNTEMNRRPGPPRTASAIPGT
jgi:hypothetical protein